MIEEGIIEDKRISENDGKGGESALPSIKLTEDSKGLSDLRFSWAAPGEAGAEGESPVGST